MRIWREEVLEVLPIIIGTLLKDIIAGYEPNASSVCSRIANDGLLRAHECMSNPQANRAPNYVSSPVANDASQLVIQHYSERQAIRDSPRVSSPVANDASQLVIQHYSVRQAIRDSPQKDLGILHPSGVPTRAVASPSLNFVSNACHLRKANQTCGILPLSGIRMPSVTSPPTEARLSNASYLAGFSP